MLLCFFGTLLANTELLLVQLIWKSTTIFPKPDNIKHNPGNILIHLFNSRVCSQSSLILFDFGSAFMIACSIPLWTVLCNLVFWEWKNTQVMVILTNKLTIIEGCESIIADFAASVELLSSHFSVAILWQELVPYMLKYVPKFFQN